MALAGIFSTPIVSPVTVSLNELTDFQSDLEDDIEFGFFDENEFAVPVKYFSTFENKFFLITGIFDEETEVVETLAEVDVLGTAPAIQIQTSKFNFPIEENDYFLIKGQRWKFKKPENDGTGITTIFLYKG